MLGIDVEQRIDFANACGDLAGAVLEPVFAAQVELVFGEPAQIGGEGFEQRRCLGCR